jgi:hypothetical protein
MAVDRGVETRLSSGLRSGQGSEQSSEQSSGRTVPECRAALLDPTLPDEDWYGIVAELLRPPWTKLQGRQDLPDERGGAGEPGGAGPEAV